MSHDQRPRYDATGLRRFMAEVLEHYGVPAGDAAVGADVLIHADLSGVDTHGISNFVSHWHYAPGLRDGVVDPRPDVTVTRDSPVAAAWDGGGGFGPVIAHRAMTAAIDKAAATGIGTVTVRNACHFGAHAYFAAMAADHDMIGMTMSHTAPSATSPGGLDKVVGTNPLGVAAPVAGRHPFVLDMATTAAAGTRVVRARLRGDAIPWGILADEHGQVTTDPEAFVRGGAMLPLGSTADAGAYKGLGLGLVVDIVSGVLSGAGSGLFHTFGPHWRLGYWMAAWRIDAFVDAGEFKLEMARMVDKIHTGRPTPGHDTVLVPGDRAALTRLERGRNGVPLDQTVLDNCRTFSMETGIAFPDPIA